MMRISSALLLATVLVLPIAVRGDILPDITGDAQAIALTGESLFSGEPSESILANLDAALADYEREPDSADSIIWYGRRLAYAGNYRGAIEAFSEGIFKFPRDARLFRHRGHRYITIREFDRAIEDLERAAALIEGTENEIEPDGAPNPLGIPVSSLHGNIWYHLGLAYYLKHDWENALRAYDNGFAVSRNDDNRVSTTHWRYMILRRLGRDADATKVLDAISQEMEIIENMSYHALCLFYKGELSLEELLGDGDDSPAGAAVQYGAANWFWYNGDQERAREMFETLTATSGWAGFGYIAAEAELAALESE